MKPILAVIIFIGISINLHSQIEKPITKGNKLLTGDLSMSLAVDPEYAFHSSVLPSVAAKKFSTSINAGAAFFVFDHLAVGPIFNFGYYKTGVNSQETRIGVGPIIRYYLFNGLYIKAEAVCQLLSYKDGHTDREISRLFYYVSPGLGYSLFLNSKVSIDPCLNYYFDSLHLIGGEGGKLSSDSNIRITVGISVYL